MLPCNIARQFVEILKKIDFSQYQNIENIENDDYVYLLHDFCDNFPRYLFQRFITELDLIFWGWERRIIESFVVALEGQFHCYNCQKPHVDYEAVRKVLENSGIDFKKIGQNLDCLRKARPNFCNIPSFYRNENFM